MGPFMDLVTALLRHDRLSIFLPTEGRQLSRVEAISDSKRSHSKPGE